MTDPITGVFGKLPALGDFVTRRLPARFVAPWDEWLQEAIAASQSRLGPHWLDTYLTSPLWRFVLTPGIAGDSGWAGVLMPSVDSVGRYFPLTLAIAVDPGIEPLRTAAERDWFDGVERLALATLGDGFDLDALEAGLAALPDLPGAVIVDALGWTPGPAAIASPTLTSAPTGIPAAVRADAWQVDLSAAADPREACPGLAAQALAEVFFAYSLWWTEGSAQVAPSLLACQGLPAADAVTAMLAGDWTAAGWHRLGGPR